MSPMLHNEYAYKVGFPRVSGDEPGGKSRSEWLRWFSPRERG